MRTSFLPFAIPTMDETDVAEVAEVVRSGWLTTGPRAQKFELEMATEIGTGGALAVSSGSAALHLALTAMDITPGSWVITTPLTFCATAHAIEHVGCRPWFVDVEPDTLNIDPAAVARALDEGREVGALLPVHYGGHPVQLGPLLDLARGRDLPVVEDAAHAFGAEYRGEPVGRIDPDDDRRAVAFSLYATKNITSAEGGVLTASETVLERSRLWSLHGMSRDSWARYGPRGSWDYEVVVPGFKANLSDLQAALASSQLRRWRAFQERRTAIATMYSAAFEDVDEVETPGQHDDVVHAWHLFPLRLRLGMLDIGRAAFVEELRELHIGTSVHFIPLHEQPYYRDRYGLKPSEFPVATREFERLVSLPLYPRMSDEDVADVVEAVRDVVAAHRRTRW